MRRIAVIGLGRFGMALARNLGKLGAQVLAIDHSMSLVNEIQNDVDLAVRLDSTDKEALIAQEIDKIDVCVVAIGENFEASLLTTVLLQKLGVPRVICRAQTQLHAEIFRQIGATEVIQPETSAGEQTARRLANPKLADLIDLAEGFSIVEIQTPTDWVGSAVKTLELRTKHDINLVAIRREPKPPEEGQPAPPHEIVSVPGPNHVLRQDDMLMLIGSHEAIDALPRD
ncbi:MAG: TrkA family potassium uptake protein [Planctomycetota bacterium]|nr:TrkA family potassium uptake protein [Planctomycetota bacterium]MDA1248559.1 TrkA family potassium uptake protein [Planctomycetota bacterium]